MRPRSIIGREVAELLSRPLPLAVKFAYPLVVGVPLLFSTAPPFYAAMALTMLAALLGGLGTAAVLARERASGLQLRFRLLPVAGGQLLLQRVVAAALIDFAQLVPVLVLIGLRHPGGAAWWPAALFALIGTLLTVDALGAFASSLADSPGEVMLYVLIPLLPAFYLSGLFVPMTGWLGVVSELLPFRHLHDALFGALGGVPGSSPLTAALAGLAWSLIGAAIALTTGTRVLEAES